MIKKCFYAFVILLLISGCGNNNEQTDKPNANHGVENQQDRESPQTKEVISENMLIADVTIEQQNNIVYFDLSLLNETDENVKLTFPSGQYYEIIVEDEEGQTVYQYSKGKGFTQAINYVDVEAREKLKWKEEWKLPENIEAGTYEATIFINVSEVNQKKVSKEAFTVTKQMEIEKPNVAFRNVSVEGSEGHYIVTGEARVFEGVFFYSIEEGHTYLIEGKQVQVKSGAPTWSPFEINISIPENKLPQNATLTLELYEKSAKTGLPTNMYYLKLDQIK